MSKSARQGAWRTHRRGSRCPAERRGTGIPYVVRVGGSCCAIISGAVQVRVTEVKFEVDAARSFTTAGGVVSFSRAFNAFKRPLVAVCLERSLSGSAPERIRYFSWETVRPELAGIDEIRAAVPAT